MSGVTRFATAGGAQLEYRLLPGDGTPGRPMLVFLHQGLGSISMWRDTPEALAARTGCPALVYSRYGHGGSDVLSRPRRPDFMLVEGRDVLPELLAAVGVDDVILVGHSDGATIVLAYLAAGRPARAAIVVAPHVFDEDATWRSIRAQRDAWGTDGLRERLARHHRDVERMFLAWADVWLSPAMRGWTMVPSLAAIRCPVLAMQGVDDTHGTLAQIDAIAAVSGGEVTLEKIEHCGHDPFREQPDAVLDRCVAFIDRFRAPAQRSAAAPLHAAPVGP